MGIFIPNTSPLSKTDNILFIQWWQDGSSKRNELNVQFSLIRITLERLKHTKGMKKCLYYN